MKTSIIETFNNISFICHKQEDSSPCRVKSKDVENNKEAAYTNFLVQPTIYHTQGGHANHLLHQ
jgi:hypothetical protein